MILDIELEKWQGGHLSPFQTEGCQLQLKDWGRFQIQATDSNTKFDKLNVLIFEHCTDQGHVLDFDRMVRWNTCAVDHEIKDVIVKKMHTKYCLGLWNMMKKNKMWFLQKKMAGGWEGGQTNLHENRH